MASEKATRVLITLDCDQLDADAFKAIVALANEHDVEVTGLYVEDEDLLNAARLPGLSEVSVNTGEVTALSRERIEAQIVDQARRARQQFESTARSLHYKYSFVVARGPAVETVAKTALTTDIVVVSRALRASGLRSRRGSHFAPIIERHSNLLFVNEPWASGSSVIVLCESSAGLCERALAVARRIATAEKIDLLIAVPADRSDTELPQGDRIIRLDAWTEEAIAALCERENARLLVVPPTEKLDWRALLLNTIDRLPCSLLRLD
jgi:hypothetical protein